MLIACYGLVHSCYRLVHGNDIVIYTYEIHQIHVTFYLVNVYIYIYISLLLVHEFTLYALSLICLIHDNSIIDTLHDAGIVTWWLNTKLTICMFQLIHDEHRPNAQFACYRYENMMLVLFAWLHVMGLRQWYS